MYTYILLKAKYLMEQKAVQIKTLLFVMHLEIFNKNHAEIELGLTA